MVEASSSPAGPSGANAARRPREDIDLLKAKLSDQVFSITRYADPLAPRKQSDPQFWPRDVTREMEIRWLAMIKELRST